MEGFFMILLLFVILGLMLWVYAALQNQTVWENETVSMFNPMGSKVENFQVNNSARRDLEARQVQSDLERDRWSRRWSRRWDNDRWDNDRWDWPARRYYPYRYYQWYNPLSWFPYWGRDYNTCRDYATRQCVNSVYPSQCVGNYYELCRSGLV